jgi:hypothetical protein
MILYSSFLASTSNLTRKSSSEGSRRDPLKNFWNMLARVRLWARTASMEVQWSSVALLIVCPAT